MLSFRLASYLIKATNKIFCTVSHCRTFCIHFPLVSITTYWCGFQDGTQQEAADEEDVDESWPDSDQEIFKCPYPGCEHIFKYKKGCVFHQRSKHGGVYGGDKLVAFFCRIKNCGRTFYSRSSLAKHQKDLHGLTCVSDANFTL